MNWQDLRFHIVVVKAAQGPELVLACSLTQFALEKEEAEKMWGERMKSLGVEIVRVAKVYLKEVEEDDRDRESVSSGLSEERV